MNIQYFCKRNVTLCQKEYFIFFTLGCLGLCIAFYPLILSGHVFLPGDIGDGRFNHYVLEYGWQWIQGNTVADSYWNAPFFYPAKNTMAFSDILIGIAPIYYLSRSLMISAEYSFLIWAIFLVIANYVAMYLLLRKTFFFDPLSAAIGAFLFSFCAARMEKLGHIQMVAQFYSVLYIYMVNKFYIYREVGNYKSSLYLVLATIFLVLQLYSGWYHGWFLVFGTTVYLLICLSFSKSRQVIFCIVKTKCVLLCFCMLLCVFLLYPMAEHYLNVAMIHGVRDYDNSVSMLTRWDTWIRSHSFVYSSLDLSSIPMSHEHLGLGIVTFLCSCVGLFFLSRKNVWLFCFALTPLVIFVLTLSVYGNSFSLWSIVWDIFPGASSVRAVSRIFFLVLIVFSIGFAYLVSRQRMAIAFGLLLLCIAENIGQPRLQYPVYFTQKNVVPVVEIVKKYDVPFVLLNEESLQSYDFSRDLTAMWASLIANKTTLNGYSGLFPEDYSSLIMHATCEGFQSSFSTLMVPLNVLLVCRNSDGTYTKQILKMPDLYVRGLSHLESWGQWSNGDVVTILDRYRLLPEKFILELDVAMVFADNAKYPFVIRVGTQEKRVNISKAGKYSILFENNVDGENKIEIIVPKAQSPKELGLSGDARELGIGFAKGGIKITKQE